MDLAVVDGLDLRIGQDVAGPRRNAGVVVAARVIEAIIPQCGRWRRTGVLNPGCVEGNDVVRDDGPRVGAVDAAGLARAVA